MKRQSAVTCLYANSYCQTTTKCRMHALQQMTEHRPPSRCPELLSSFAVLSCLSITAMHCLTAIRYSSCCAFLLVSRTIGAIFGMRIGVFFLYSWYCGSAPNLNNHRDTQGHSGMRATHRNNVVE